jgi:hypothetical protein
MKFVLKRSSGEVLRSCEFWSRVKRIQPVHPADNPPESFSDMLFHRFFVYIFGYSILMCRAEGGGGQEHHTRPDFYNHIIAGRNERQHCSRWTLLFLAPPPPCGGHFQNNVAMSNVQKKFHIFCCHLITASGIHPEPFFYSYLRIVSTVTNIIFILCVSKRKLGI